MPSVGDTVVAVLDWERRYRHMRMHTAMHLLGSILQFGVTGGNISAEKSRLDFDMEEPVDKEAVGAALLKLVAEDHAVSCRWITEEELDAQPELVRTMSVQPPRGKGNVRLLEIDGVDLQPCGGTHLRTTSEVGAVRIGKVEKKGRHNRRVNIHLDD
jgi:misacylated tRNA(Ala) deacylase